MFVLTLRAFATLGSMLVASAEALATLTRAERGIFAECFVF